MSTTTKFKALNMRPALCLAVMLVISGPVAVVPGEVWAQDTGLTPSAELKEIVDQIKSVTKAAKAGLKELKGGHFSNSVIIDETGLEATAILEWVRAETRWTPYQGALRGSSGMLMDRVGNSLDRSLLLAALLEETGMETRLVRAELDPALVGTLLSQYLSTPPAERVEPQFGKPGQAVTVENNVANNARELVRLSGLSFSTEDTSRIEAALRDHWWVQARLTGTWNDFDPDTGVASNSIAPSEILTIEKLPHELFHKLRFRVVAGKWEKGDVAELTVAEHEMTPARQSGLAELNLEFHPAFPSAKEDKSAKPAEVLSRALPEATHWLPVLKVDDVPITGDWFSAEGLAELPPNLVSAQYERAVSALGGLTAGAESKMADTHLCAVWLDYELTQPGLPARTIRRELFDFCGDLEIDPAGVQPGDKLVLERAKALMTSTGVLLMNALPRVENLQKVLLETMIESENAFIASAYLDHGLGDDPRVPRALAQARMRPLDLWAMAVARGQWGRFRNLVFLDEINIWSNHFLVSPEGPNLVYGLAIDIVANRVGSFPGGEVPPGLVRLEQGVLDTMIERELSIMPDGANPFTAFSQRGGEGGTWSQVAEGQLARNKPYPAVEINRFKKAFELGFKVVASDRLFAVGGVEFPMWWQVDARDGSTLGRGFRGWGPIVAERTEFEGVNTTRIAEIVKAKEAEEAKKMLCAVEAVTELIVIPGPIQGVPYNLYGADCWVAPHFRVY